jgi:tetratricopeptide (TPR) repeat protein
MARSSTSEPRKWLGRVKLGWRSVLVALTATLASLAAIGDYVAKTHYFFKDELGINLPQIIKDIPVVLLPGKPPELTPYQRKALGELQTKFKSQLEAGTSLDAESLLKLGNLEYAVGNTTKAEEYYNNARKRAKEKQDSGNEAVALANLATMQQERSEYDAALKSLETAGARFVESNRLEAAADSFTRMAVISKHK